MDETFRSTCEKSQKKKKKNRTKAAREQAGKLGEEGQNSETPLHDSTSMVDCLSDYKDSDGHVNIGPVGSKRNTGKLTGRKKYTPG